MWMRVNEVETESQGKEKSEKEKITQQVRI
jgi:hypothetical protein